jgi:hypothetical protein
MAGDWSDEQNDAIVADYFAMLADDISRQPYSKAEHNRNLQATIGRPRGSIEYKHQNISAVSLKLAPSGPAYVHAILRWSTLALWSGFTPFGKRGQIRDAR